MRQPTFEKRVERPDSSLWGALFWGFVALYFSGYVACRVTGVLVRHEFDLAEKLGRNTAIFCAKYRWRDSGWVKGLEYVYYPLRVAETLAWYRRMP